MKAPLSVVLLAACLLLSAPALGVTALGVTALGVTRPVAPPVTSPSAPAVPPLAPPGQLQPLAPGTRPALALPSLTLTPPMPQLHALHYLSNGHLEVAGAVLTLTLQEQPLPSLKALAGLAAQRALAARASLDEVDVSVYDRASYGGFGGPLPLLTASVPRARLPDFLAWTAGRGEYERSWINEAPHPPTRQPEQLRENRVAFLGAAVDAALDTVQQTTAKVRGGVQAGLLYRGDAKLAAAALTFDDAPHPLYEPLLLDLLARAHVRATFFIIGRNARAYPYFVRDLVQGGHEIANHTYHHVRLPPLSSEAASTEMQDANAVLTGITGLPVRYFRPPGGQYTPATLRLARALGLITVFWTDDPGDFQNPGPEVLEARFGRQLRNGGIIVLHDNAREMIRVLPRLIDLAGERGIGLGTVGQLVNRAIPLLPRPAAGRDGAARPNPRQ